MNKKAELTTQQIVGIIILIISFVVILFFIFRLNFQETTDKEICHNSVALKAQSALISGPLDCKTSYVCISGGKKCEEFSESVTRDIDLKKENVKEQVMEAIAEEMADCWWMFGEGKVDYVGDWINKPDILETHRCAICSIIQFSKDIEIDDLTYGNVEIDLNERYAIITGMEDKNEYIKPLIVNTKEISTNTSCDEFLTKA